MTARRTLLRLWRRLKRPSFSRLVVASLALHLAGLTVAAWLVTGAWVPVARPPEPLVVELPPAEAGRPLVRPEDAAPRRASPPPRAVRPAPARPAPSPSPAVPEPPPAARAPSSAPVVPSARAPEPPPAAPPATPSHPEPPAPVPAPEPAPGPAPSPPAPPPAVARVVPPSPPAVTPPSPPAVTPPSPPAVTPPSPSAVTPPSPSGVTSPSSPTDAPTGARSSPIAPAPSGPPPASTPSESPFAGRAFSLLRPQLDVPPLPRPLPGGGGTAREGEGSGDGGREREGGPAIPLNKPPDPDHADYFGKVKKAIEDHWSYPSEAARRGQSGQLVLEFMIRKDGNVLVELVRSSGIDILDRYAVNAVKLSAPFPPVPDRLGDSLRISASFTYILDHGFRVFGLR